MATKKITLNELRSIVKQIINELDTSTYANLMNNTSDYPWTQFLGADTEDNYTNPKHKGQKEERVNKKSRERFLEEFYKEFPKNSISTKILTNEGEYNFHGIRFTTNYSSYDLSFEQKGSYWKSLLWIQPEHDGYYIDDKSIKITDANSDNLINQMLKYNLVKK